MVRGRREGRRRWERAVRLGSSAGGVSAGSSQCDAREAREEEARTASSYARPRTSTTVDDDVKDFLVELLGVGRAPRFPDGFRGRGG